MEGHRAALGHRAERIVPWFASFLIHLGLVALGFLVTWTVTMLDDAPPPPIVEADFDALELQAQAAVAAAQPAEPQSARAADPMPQPPAPTPSNAPAPPLELMPLPAAPTGGAPAPAVGEAAEFVGLTASNARRIVYVIDASGSMIRALPIVIDELARSLERLGPRQEFGVVFFQENRAVVAPPRGRLVAATDQEKRRALAWIREEVIPRGRSNPVAALEYALQLRPDAVFVLSENITGAGEFEVDQRDLLDLLERLNPVDPALGRRPVRINCIQFLDPDPLDTLKRIAEIHGGANGWKFLDRAELGLRR